MLGKQAKEILKQHDELHWLEKKISNNVRKLAHSAENELKKFFKTKKKKFKVKFYPLQANMFSRDWKAVMLIKSVSPEIQKEDWNDFQNLLLEASEKIGIEFKFE